VLALVGEPGIGKSALLAYATESADGMNVLTAGGVQSEAQIPFAGLFELLRPALGSLDLIPAPQARALEGALALRPAHSEDRFAIGAATLSLLAAYAERQPLLVTLEDVQWLDGSSANALRFAARRLAEDPIAILLTVRAGEPSLLDGTDLPRLPLEGLDLLAAADLLSSQVRVGSRIRAAQLERLHRETGGNPLALLELSQETAWLEDSPVHEPATVVPSVARAYANRFEGMSSQIRQLLVLLAAGDSTEMSTVLRAAKSLGLARENLDEAAKTGLIEMSGQRFEWRHPLARSAVYGQATTAERRSAHRALADALPDADGDRRAWHLALAALGADEPASAALEQAAERARARSAYDVASRSFERSAVLADEPARQAELLFAAADSAWLAGLGDRAVDLLDEAATRLTGPGLAIRIEQLRGHIATRRGRVEDGRRILVEAATAASSIDSSAAVVMLAEAVNASFYAGDAAAMASLAEKIRAVRRQASWLDSRAEFFAAMGEGMALIFSGEGALGPSRIRQAVALLEESDELRDDPRVLAWAAMGPLWLRDASAGGSLVERALRVARERSIVGVLPFVLSHVAIYQAASEQWIEAEAGFHEGIDMAREGGHAAELGASLARLACLEARSGKEEACRSHAHEALELSGRLGLGIGEVWALAALGDLELVLGNPELATEWYERKLSALKARVINDVDMSPGPELVEVYLRAGRRPSAEAAAVAYAADAAAKGLPWALARARRAQALLASDAEYEALFGEAISFHAATVDLFETARTHLAFGSRLRRDRQRVRARTELRIAIAAFDQLGAVPWAEVARTELAASGERAKRRDESAISQLTPQELQIALLLAEGRTTREAAASLFISPKTVEYHLRGVYRKLAINNRESLAARMTGTDSLPSLRTTGG
jgi:DNA-binding CsgD family transcriptional regulator